MAQQWHAYDGSSWRKIIAPYVYDGSAWRKLKEAWVYDGSAWRQFFAECTATLDTADATSDGAGGCCGCAAGKCDITISWTSTGASDADSHIRILRSINGGSYLEIADDLTIGVGGSGSYSDSCQTDGNSLSYHVRLEDDSTDLLTCRDSNNEITATENPCAVV